jgi:Protein of unknown function (DUF3987)
MFKQNDMLNGRAQSAGNEQVATDFRLLKPGGSGHPLSLANGGIMSGTKFLLELSRMQLEFNDDLASACNGRAGKQLESCPGPTLATPPKPTTATNSEADDQEKVLKPFPLETLPPTFRRFAEEMCRSYQVPEALSACCILGIISACLGKGLMVQSAEDRITLANIFVMASALSGTGKSVTFKRALAELLKFQFEFVEKWRKRTFPKLKVRKKIAEIVLKRLETMLAKEDPEGDAYAKIEEETADKQAELDALELAMKEPSFFVDNITSEKLTMMLGENGETQASLSADAGAILQNILGRYVPSEQTDEQVYLKGYSGDLIRVDRVSRMSDLVNEPCLSVLWLVQPEKITTLFAKATLTDGGLMPRIMMCHTHCQPKEKPKRNRGINPEVANAYDKAISTLLTTYRISSAPVLIKVQPEVDDYFTDHFNRIVRRRLSDLQDINSFAARWNEWAWRISVCLHGATHLDKAAEHSLSMQTAEDACAIADWFSEELLSILREKRVDKRLDKKQHLLDKIFKLIALKPRGISARDVLRDRLAPTAEEAKKILEELTADGILYAFDVAPPGGGKKTRLHRRNNQN